MNSLIASERSEEMMREPWVERNFRGQLLDTYGNEIYDGAPLSNRRQAIPQMMTGHAERYLVWVGYTRQSKQGIATCRTFYKAVKLAIKMQRRGFYARITDRLIVEDVK